MKIKQVELFYDIVSPYSLLAFELRPCFLGGVMGATGNKPPIAVAPKGVYTYKDFFRNAKHFDIPMAMPPKFPANTIQAMRALTLLSEEKPELVPHASRGLWASYWQNQQDIEDPEVLVSALATSTGVSVDEAKAWLAACSDAAVKDALRATTDELVERGGFGAPTFFITPAAPSSDHDSTDDSAEMFFGSDRFELIASMYGLPYYGPRGQPPSKL